ncbi:MAG TPA: hypothetical protein VNX87_25420 [Candidatus Sulfotelmatobacter sp.]|nr:hypothetical protein [Candidatus Sulfotelmatobacter sp.]
MTKASAHSAALALMLDSSFARSAEQRFDRPSPRFWYQRQPDGVWFPATLGAEFRIRAAFVINRQVSMSLENSAFEHTHVVSRMKVFGEVE